MAVSSACSRSRPDQFALQLGVQLAAPALAQGGLHPVRQGGAAQLPVAPDQLHAGLFLPLWPLQFVFENPLLFAPQQSQGPV